MVPTTLLREPETAVDLGLTKPPEKDELKEHVRPGNVWQIGNVFWEPPEDLQKSFLLWNGIVPL